MPGERLAKMTLRVNLIHFIFTPLFQFRLGGTEIIFKPSDDYRYYPAGTSPEVYEFNDYHGQPDELMRATDSLLARIRTACADHGFPYSVSARRPSSVTGSFEFDIEALIYDRSYDLVFSLAGYNNNPFIEEVSNVSTIRPVFFTRSVVDALIFDTPTGSMTVVGQNGNTGVYTYLWDDAGAPANGARTNVKAGTYYCTISDASGAYAVAMVQVGSDPRLDVLVTRTGDDVTLVPSGGLPGYTYAWADGPTTAARPGLSVGTYSCTVTDARGATRVVQVVIDPYRYYWSLNPVTLALDAGAGYRADPSTKPNLSFRCQVWVELDYLSGTYEQVGVELEQPSDPEGRTVFDVQALLDAYLAAALPAAGESQVRLASGQFRRFYLKAGEKFGSPPVAAALTNQTQHYVVLGGLDFMAYPEATWFDYQRALQPFLTWEPNDKSVLPAQPELLAYMPTKALPAFRLWVRQWLSDGSSQNVMRQQVSSVKRFEVYHVPAGYQQLQLGGSTSTGLSVVAWDVWLTDTNNVPVSEVRRYQLDTSYYREQRFFIYLNSLGGWNTLAALGEAKRTLDVEGESVERGLAPGYDPLQGTTLTLSRTAKGVLAVNTGPRRRAQLVADQELLLSRRVLLLRDGQYWPGTIPPKSFTLVDESAALNSLEFEFHLASSPLFTPRLPAVLAGRAVTPVAGGEGAQP